jgi:hypothetical protein
MLYAKGQLPFRFHWLELIDVHLIGNFRVQNTSGLVQHWLPEESEFINILMI